MKGTEIKKKNARKEGKKEKNEKEETREKIVTNEGMYEEKSKKPDKQSVDADKKSI